SGCPARPRPGAGSRRARQRRRTCRRLRRSFARDRCSRHLRPRSRGRSGDPDAAAAVAQPAGGDDSGGRRRRAGAARAGEAGRRAIPVDGGRRAPLRPAARRARLRRLRAGDGGGGHPAAGGEAAAISRAYDRRERQRGERMNLELNDKVVVVTGASRGIGRAIALGMAAEGARVVAVARDKTALDKLVTEARARSKKDAVAVGADLSQLAEVERVVEEARRAGGGRIDVLVNNAGAIRGGGFLDMP